MPTSTLPVLLNSKPEKRTTKDLPKRPELPRSLRQLWEEKFEFNRTKLGLDDEKAAEFADRTIRAVQTVNEAVA